MFKRSRLNVAALLTVYGLVGTAEAQTAQRVEITGSSIKRIDTETALPVTVITRDQIEKSGAVSVEDLLRRVSANGAGVSDSVQGAGFATSNANLRAPLAETRRNKSSMLTAPLFSIWSRVITVTGSAVSVSIRLIDEPVISTRWVWDSAARLARPSSTAALSFDRLNIRTFR